MVVAWIAVSLAFAVGLRVAKGASPGWQAQAAPDGDEVFPLSPMLLSKMVEDDNPFMMGNGPSSHPRPLIVHAGPSAEVAFAESMLPQLLLQDLLRSTAAFDLGDLPMDPSRSLLGGPKPRLRLRQPLFTRQSAERFQESYENGHFRLRGEVPGYNLISDKPNEPGQPEPDQANNSPLKVSVVGRTLVVEGSRHDDKVTSSWTRSWALPPKADVDAIAVSFIKANHTLIVDVPEKSGAKTDAPIEELARPADLALPPGFEDLKGFQQDMDGSGTMLLLSSMAMPGIFPGEQDDGLGAGPMFMFSSSGLPGPFGMDEAVPRPPEPMVVQHKEAQPYWRLGSSSGPSDRANLEVVLPKGVVVGKPEEKRVPVHWSDETKGQASLDPVDLPVPVQSDACQQQPGLLRCPIADATDVRRLQIDPLDEL